MVEEIRERRLQFLRTGVRTFPKRPWDVDGDGLQGFLRVLQDDGGIQGIQLVAQPIQAGCAVEVSPVMKEVHFRG